MKSNINDLPIGERGTLKDFKRKYTIDFLKEHGFNCYQLKVFGVIANIYLYSVNTKYGEMIVHKDNAVSKDIAITYVGDGVWSVSKERKENE